jgi:hypothetical protein
LIFIFLIPGIQTYTAKKITKNLNETYGTKIDIERVKINLNTNISLENAIVLDHQNDTLFNVKSLSTSIFNLSDLITGSSLDLSSTEIDGFDFKLIQYKGESSDNLNQFLSKFDTGTPSESSEPLMLHIDDIYLTNSNFEVIDYNLTDPNVFGIKDIILDLNNVNIYGSDISLNINTLAGLTSFGVKIDRLKSKFFYGENDMRLSELEINTPNSYVDSNIYFKFNVGDWSDFENKINITADFKNSEISTTDLKYFYDEFGTSKTLNLNGKIEGILNDFTFENIDITGIRKSSIKGEIRFQNVTDSEQFKLISNDVDITSNYNDLKDLLPNVFGENVPAFIENLEDFNLKGKTYINKDDISAELYLISKNGEGDINIDFKNINQEESVEYTGSLDLKNLNLGKLAETKSLGLSSFNVNVNGKGFTAESLDTEVTGKLEFIEINNYRYNNINVDGNLKYPIFDGKLESLDPNFLFNFEGLVDASQEINTYKFSSEVKYADLYLLNFIEKDEVSIFKGKLDIDMKANSIDDAIGEITFENFNYLNSYENYSFEDFKLTSQIVDNNKLIELTSPDLINGKLYGNFELSKLPSFFEYSIRNLYFKTNDDKKYANKNVSFEFQIYNKVVEAFFPNIKIAPNTFLNGKISANENDMNIRFISPEIKILENVFKNVEIQLDEQNPFFDTYINIGELNNTLYSVSDFNLINVKLNDTLFFRTEFNGLKNSDNFNLSFYQTFDKDKNTIVGFQKSNFNFKDREWQINPENDYKINKVTLEPGLQNFRFDSIKISHKDQFMKLTGELRDSTYKDINLKLKDVSLNNLTPFIDSLNLDGKINGYVNIFQEKSKYAPNLDFSIQDFEVNDVNYGELKLFADGNKDLTDFNINALLSNEKSAFLEASGKISNENDQQYINLDAKLNDLDISSLSPLGEDVLNQLRGSLTGSATVSGELSNPDINGVINLKEAGLKIPYLNVDFDFKNNSKIALERKRFIFQDIELTDTKYKTKGILSGFISHSQFSNWELNLNLNSDNILTLDTDFDEESLYYGTAFINGSASIIGPTDELEINVNATSQPNTTFNIPISDAETIGEYTFIYFLTPEEKLNKVQGKEFIYDKIAGLKLNFDLKINENALIEVVIDQDSGSKLKGRGDGDLRLEINTNGKFDMYGDFVALNGEYIYKYQGLIEKKFDVVPGGYLSWEGDPIKANMDIQAKYRTNANPATLLDNPSINREIPVDVIIALKGDLMQPDINFDLEYPNLSSIIQSELEFRMQGEENKEIQALSLVVQGSFYNDEGVGFNTIGSNLVAERATSILDQILRDEEGKFNVGFDYVQAERTPNQNAVGSDRVGLTLQTQLNDKIFINGRFGVPVGGQTQSFVFGDVEINFLLNKSGSLRAQMFNRESDIQFIGEELGYAQGIGVLYTVDFETFGSLIRKIWGIKEEDLQTEKNKTNEPNAENTSLVPSYIKLPN